MALQKIGDHVLFFNLGPVYAAEVYIYEEGTETLASLYMDAAGTLPQANPVITDGLGLWECWIAPGTYDRKAAAGGAETERTSWAVIDSAGGGGSSVADYSLAEHLTGENWIDGAPIYRKVIPTGYLPNASTMLIAHGVTGVAKAFAPAGEVTNGTVPALPVPYIDPSALSDGIGVIWLDDTNFRIETGSNRTTYSGHIVLRYTKT